MSDTIIKLENISKQYRLGLVGTNTLRGDMQRIWYKMRGKDDPTLKIGQENTLAKAGGEYVWALRDINLDVKKGEVLGIIGKNGAGKSTLLKLLSRVTGPTTGVIKIKGKIASLLEVGTGFHPELTGRENVFLNGAILGMTKNDVRKKLDEIVDFAGVAKYLETPVKRYSSGMRVRLGFAVAAFLEPDILVVDEVLAVGDAEFQKKAIGKMQDVSKGEGRTVLFVSHNMASVKALCTRGVLLENGSIKMIGETNDVIENYLKKNKVSEKLDNAWNEDDTPGDEKIKLLKASIEKHGEFISMSSDFFVKLRVKFEENTENFATTFHLINEDETIVLGSGSGVKSKSYNKGEYNLSCEIPGNLLNTGRYSIKLLLVKNSKTFQVIDDLLIFNIVDDTQRDGWFGKLKGVVRPNLKWEINESWV